MFISCKKIFCLCVNIIFIYIVSWPKVYQIAFKKKNFLELFISVIMSWSCCTVFQSDRDSGLH